MKTDTFHFTSKKKDITKKIEKEYLFFEREKKIIWREEELTEAEQDKEVFLKFGQFAGRQLSQIVFTSFPE